MDRRQFIKLGGFITVSAATGGLAGCGGGSDSPAPAPGLPPATGANWKFPQSVASGDPRADSIMLWTRVVPTSLDDVATVAAKSGVTVRVQVTAADNTASLGGNKALEGATVVDAQIELNADFDNTIRHKVTGLLPNTAYFYQFTAGDVRSNVARFKTAAAADASVDQLKFAYLTCQDWSINHWGALDHIAKNEKLDFIVHLGDYIYETVGEGFQAGSVEKRHAELKLPDGTFKNGASGAKYATTLADYRYLYKTYRTDTRLQAVHERFAFIAIWDDHEFSDDCWGDTQTYAEGEKHDTPRRRSANQAWFEFMPADVTLDSAATGFQNIKIYRDFKFGKLMQLVMTDERLYRADHVVPEQMANPATGLPLGSIGARYLVAQDLYNGVEAQKMAAATAAGADPLSVAGMLGATQRDWWKSTMKASSATWKLWGNEVSLLRMGMNGTDAIATLIALQAVGTLAKTIGDTAIGSTGGNVPVAAAIVAAMTAGASASVASGAAMAIAGVAAGGGDTSARLTAAVGAGLTSTQAGVAVLAFGQAENVAKAAGDATAQATAAAQGIAIGYIKPDIQANKAASPIVVASGKAAALAPYFRKFLINCDQWDGYNAERKALMSHLKTNAIGNVVALTGDIHSFFAGTVSDDYDAAGGGTPVMVDLVSAGASSDSFFTYLRDAAKSLGAELATLVSWPLQLPVPNVGIVDLDLNLLDYTLGKAAPTADTLAASLTVQLRGALGAKGVPEAALDATVDAVLAGLKADATFSSQLVPLAQQLAGLNSNPHLRHVNTDAQGFTVVTLTPGSLTAQFKQVNKLVGGNAPANVIAKITTAAVTAGQASVNVY
ncbi:alkaline phosphatase [Duganella sp. Root198D2]|uniref:alkaline phosphatase D family protein n=1 Tax=Duganella sp. Root198D2 TaxID=1736489 RepID=UPI00070C44AA|nr:alkaline phosphatase D family protein [Duganella sp. Root198D2]KRB98160.1 phosphodiesterase [Duganella sp. Root198D2]